MKSQKHLYIFPFFRVPKGSRVFLYGAGQVGHDFLNQIYGNPTCAITVSGFLDRNYQNSPSYYGIPVYPPEQAKDTDLYDYIVISSPQNRESMAQTLCGLGIPTERVIKTAITGSLSKRPALHDLFMQFFEREDRFELARLAENKNPVAQALLSCLTDYWNTDFISQPEKLCLPISIYKQYFIEPLPTSENTHYGHGFALINYSGFRSSASEIILPSMEHGLHRCAGTFISNILEGTPTLITFSPLRKESIRLSSSLPVFTIGPYIHYADMGVSQQRFRDMKERFGRTLLFYPHHTWGGYGESHIKKDKFFDYLLSIKSKYDTLIACVYGDDYSTETISFYKTLGIQAYTSGIKWDPHCLGRQKLLISLADDVLIDEFSTSVGYFLLMNKSVLYFRRDIARAYESSKDSSTEASARLRNIFRRAEDAFTLADNPPSAETLSLCNYIFGLDRIRTPQEIRSMIEINSTIYTRSHGDAVFMGDETQRYLDELSGCENPEAQMKYDLLSEAMS